MVARVRGSLALSSSVVGVWVGRWEVRACEVRASFGAVRLVGLCLVGGRVGQVVRGVLGGHTPLQVPLAGTFDPRHAVGRQPAATNYS